MRSPVITVAPDVTVKDAARVLLRCAITAAPVVTASGGLVGVDGSEPSKQALPWTVAQAALNSATVQAVIAWAYPISYGSSALTEVDCP